MTKSIFLPLLLLAGQSLAAGSGSNRMLEVPVQETCQEHITVTPPVTIQDWPKRALRRPVNAYVVISYDLDGSGKAKNSEVTDSKPKGLFDRATLNILERTDFALGIEATSCTYVRTYGAVRRAER